MREAGVGGEDTSFLPFAPQIDRGDCDERAIRVAGRASDSESGTARAAPAGPTKCSFVRRLRWNAQPAYQSYEEGDVHKSRNVNGQRRCASFAIVIRRQISVR
jgi:hypothetical protein